MPGIGETIKETARRAADRAEEVCRHWLPNGKRNGSEWVAGNTDGDAGRSLSVHLSGTKAGIWKDFSTEETGGDLVALVAAVDRCSQGDAATRLGAFLGMNPPAASRPRAQRPAAGWAPVLPVPTQAPPPPARHPKRGKPDVRNEYRDTTGALLFCVDRWEARADGEGKAFAWLTWCVDGKRAEWRYQGVPEPRPLFGLDTLARDADARVFLVEGEKAALAARALLPDAVTLSWPGGAGAVQKTDFRPLQGRHVILWPDADDRGRDAMVQAARQLRAAGAASVRWLSLPLLARALKLGELPAGFDAADLDAAGWTGEQLSAFLAQPAAIIDGKPAARKATPAAPAGSARYQVRDDGVFHIVPDNGGGAQRLVRISDRLEGVSLARDADSSGWSVLLRFQNRDGEEVELLIPHRTLLGDGLDAIRQLADAGLRVEPGRPALEALKQYLATLDPKDRVRTVETLGWHGDRYVFPAEVIDQSSGAGETLVYAGGRITHNVYVQSGKLAEWKKHVATLAKGNPRLMFALSAAFAGPLLHRVGAANFGVHWLGDSSTGKSTLLHAAGSVFGDPSGMVRSWRSTDNALEYVAAQHCDGVLLLDELKEVAPHLAGQIVYMLSNGIGKARGHHAGGLRDPIMWRLVLQSSGEIGLADHIASSGQRTHAGQSVRLIELSASGRHHGAWDNLHHLPDGAAFSDHLRAQVRKYHGTAGRAFIEQLIQHLGDVRPLVQTIEDRLGCDELLRNAGGQVRRVMASFAIAAAAGALAARWGIVPWGEDEAVHAAGDMLHCWVRSRPTIGNLEDHQILQHVVHVVERDWQSKFHDWHRLEPEEQSGSISYQFVRDGEDADTKPPRDLSHLPALINPHGFRKRDPDCPNDPRQFRLYVLPQRFREEFCNGFSMTRVARVLRDRNVLVLSDNDGLTYRETMPNGAHRSYCIRTERLWAAAAEMGLSREL